MADRARRRQRIEEVQGGARLLAAVFGSKNRFISGPAAIPSLDIDERPLVTFGNVQRESWFTSHPLSRINPSAKSAVIVAVPFQGQRKGYIALLLNSPKEPQFDAAQLFQLAALAGAIIENHGHAELTEDQPIIRVSQAIGFQESSAISEARISEPQGEEAILAFLTRTLPKKPAIKSRDGVSFLVIRRWKSQLKDTQIAAMQGLKVSSQSSTAIFAATEIVEVITQLLPVSSFAAIVPIPGGSSGIANSLSVQIAEQVAFQLNLPLRKCLIAEHVQIGSSHPKKSYKLKPYTVEGKYNDRVLLIDDIATTGTHLEKASKALIKAGSQAVSVAWIGS